MSVQKKQKGATVSTPSNNNIKSSSSSAVSTITSPGFIKLGGYSKNVTVTGTPSQNVKVKNLRTTGMTTRSQVRQSGQAQNRMIEMQMQKISTNKNVLLNIPSAQGKEPTTPSRLQNIVGVGQTNEGQSVMIRNASVKLTDIRQVGPKLKKVIVVRRPRTTNTTTCKQVLQSVEVIQPSNNRSKRSLAIPELSKYTHAKIVEPAGPLWGQPNILRKNRKCQKKTVDEVIVPIEIQNTNVATVNEFVSIPIIVVHLPTSSASAATTTTKENFNKFS